MKKFLLVLFLVISCAAHSQSVFGYWYGSANVKTKSSASNYLVELILQPERGYVKGVMNYYFKNTYRSLQVKGNYNAATRQLSLYDIPVTYYGSISNMEVDCIMNFKATLRVAQSGSNLSGAFIGLPEYKYTCPDITFNLGLNSDISKKDSVLEALRHFKENFQVWKPSAYDTLPSVNIVQRKVVNYVIEKQYQEREDVVSDEIEVESDSLKVDFYDNGEIDGDSISVFFNKQLMAFNQRLSARSIHFNILLDSSKTINELSMFADNLGSIPPNTALMVIEDGKNRYEVRLASNLEQNGAVRIKRKSRTPKAKTR
jgi:hypothetical protein